MASLGANPEYLLMRLTTNTVVLQCLMRRLAVKGLLAPADLADIELSALELARDLRDHSASGAQVAGARLDRDVRAFFTILLSDDEAEAGATDV